MTTVMTAPGQAGPPEMPRTVRSAARGADRVFGLSLRGAGLTVLLIMGAIGLFLLYRGSGAVAEDGLKFLTTQAWEPDSHNFGIATVITGTLLIAAVAIVFAVPLAIGVALYISEYAPRRLRRTMINIVDLMAAVPGVVYGLWGAALLNPEAIPLTRWLSSTFGWVPFLGISDAHPDDPLETRDHLRVLDVHRRGRSGADGHADHLRGDAGVLLPSPGRRAGGRVRAGRHPVGDDPHSRAAIRQRRDDRRHDARARPGDGRDDRRVQDHNSGLPYPAGDPAQRRQLGGGADRAAVRGGQPVRISALFAAGLALFALTLVVNFGASAIIARSRSGQLSEA